MQSKFIEIRDEMTCIAALAVRISPESLESVEARFARKSGWEDAGTYLITLSNPRVAYNDDAWNGCRTMTTAHRWIKENWHKIESGDVVDVRVILGEATAAAEPEIFQRRGR